MLDITIFFLEELFLTPICPSITYLFVHCSPPRALLLLNSGIFILLFYKCRNAIPLI